MAARQLVQAEVSERPTSREAAIEASFRLRAKRLRVNDGPPEKDADRTWRSEGQVEIAVDPRLERAMRAGEED